MPTLATVTTGQRFQLARDFGNEPGASNPAFHPDGVTNPDGTRTVHPFPDGQPLRAGATGVVVEVVPANVKGAGDDKEDCVVLNFDGRYVSFTEAQLGQLFEEVE